MLSSHSAGDETSQIILPDEDRPLDAYKPVEPFQTVGIADDGESTKSPTAKVVLIVSVAIILIGILAGTLILAREQIVSLFDDLGSSGDVTDDSAETIKQLQAQIAALKSGSNRQNGNSVELENLRSANVSLQKAIEDEKARATALENELNSLRAGAGEVAATDDGEISRLRKDLSAERSRADAAVLKLNEVESRMINYTRENSRLNAELDTLKSERYKYANLSRDNERLRSQVDTLERDLESAQSQIKVLRNSVEESAGSSEQLLKVNAEYRRVLELLRESREANNEKQARIDQLLKENTQLQRSLDSDGAANRASERLADSTSRISGTTQNAGLVAPSAVKIVRPKYPVSAIKRRVSGVVKLRVLVSETGNVEKAEVLSSPDPLKSLDRAAIDAVLQWRFNPAMRGGQAVRVWHSVPMEFSLSRQE
jgi:TonB family protein